LLEDVRGAVAPRDLGQRVSGIAGIAAERDLMISVIAHAGERQHPSADRLTTPLTWRWPSGPSWPSAKSWIWLLAWAARSPVSMVSAG